jgi:hypothetical protein
VKKYIALLLVCFTNSLFAQNPSGDFKDVEQFIQESEAGYDKLKLEQIKKLKQQLLALFVNDGALYNGWRESTKTADAAVDVPVAKPAPKTKSKGPIGKSLLNDESFMSALKLHVKYLLMMVNKKEAEFNRKLKIDAKAADATKEVGGFAGLNKGQTNFIQELGENEGTIKFTTEWIASYKERDRADPIGKQKLLTVGMKGSPFLIARGQETLLDGIANWYTGNLTDLPDLHRTNVIGTLRSMKDPRIFTEWEINLALEQEVATAGGARAGSHKKETFKTHRRPYLLWQIAKDHVLLGNRRAAADLLMKVLKENPLCRDYSNILADLRLIAVGKEVSAATTSIPEIDDGTETTEPIE